MVSDRLSSNKRSEDPSSLYFYFLLVTDSMSIVKANMKKLPSSSSLLWFFFTRGFFADMIFRRRKIRESNASQRDKLLFALSISHVIQYELSKEILKILAIQIIEKSLGFIISDNSIIFRQDFVHIMDLIIGNKYTLLLDDWLLILQSLFVDDHRRPGAGPPNCFPTFRTFPYFSLFDVDLRIRHLLTD